MSALLMVGLLLSGRAADAQKVEIGRVAPGFRATSLSGKPASLADLKGKVVLVNAWATWCKPCLEELPVLRRLQQEFGPKGLVVVGVSLDTAFNAPLAKFAQEHQMDYTIWRDPSQGLMTTFQFSGLPTSLLIDRRGVLRWRITNTLVPTDSLFAAALARALK